MAMSPWDTCDIQPATGTKCITFETDYAHVPDNDHISLFSYALNLSKVLIIF